jgi:KamA family protein
VLPERVNESLLDLLRTCGKTTIVVVHANHANELVGSCAAALQQLSHAATTVLNQAVLLREINDSVDALADLSERLIDVGVLPYYLHQLDRVQGAAHFEVAEERGRDLLAGLRARLPGYAVPRYVREVAGDVSKRPID